jgi:hypothetical protein
MAALEQLGDSMNTPRANRRAAPERVTGLLSFLGRHTEHFFLFYIWAFMLLFCMMTVVQLLNIYMYIIASKYFEEYDFLNPRNLNRGHSIQHHCLNHYPPIINGLSSSYIEHICLSEPHS